LEVREMMEMTWRFRIIYIIFIMSIISSCRSSNNIVYHIRPDYDFSYIKKVAVLPFENQTGDREAGEIVRHVVISQLLASGLVDVIIPGEVNSALKDLGIKNVSTLNRKHIISLGKMLKVQALILGSVQQFGHVSIGNMNAPEITITLMMADTGTGDIIWSVTRTRGGAGFMARHFGARADTMSETVLKAVKDSIRTLMHYNHF